MSAAWFWPLHSCQRQLQAFNGYRRLQKATRFLCSSIVNAHARSTASVAEPRVSHPFRQDAPRFVPSVPPISSTEIDALAGFFQDHKNVLCITGAGCSTESGIPDYRGPQGAYSTGFTPMTHQKFMASDAARRRYWARSYAGWERFAAVEPNSAHDGLVRLQQHGWVQGLLTQNVDRLHQRAGAVDVLELHGTTHIVRCMHCEWSGCRFEFQDRLRAMNPWFVQPSIYHSGRGTRSSPFQEGAAIDVIQRPDGDVELTDVDRLFELPVCLACQGVLKPDVVFFGDSVPQTKAKLADEMVEECDGVLVIGSSVSTYSVFRLLRAAKAQGKTIGAVNAGSMRADKLLSFKFPTVVGETMMRLASHPTLLLPRPVY